MHAEGQYFCSGEFVADLTGAFDAIQFWHGDVHDDDVRVEFADLFDGFAAGFGFTDDFHVELGIDKESDAFAEDGMIVSQ